MPSGGYITLINATPYAWNLTDSISNGMNTWSFPQNIGSNTQQTVFVEYGSGTAPAHADYGIEGTSDHFSVVAASGTPALGVSLNGLSTKGNVQGNSINLGWVSDDSVPFILSGKSGSYSSTSPPIDWMQQNLETIGKRTLLETAIPGSHDAGMSQCVDGTAFADAYNAQTQKLTIGGQLQTGARWFDIRPTISDGQYGTGHYSKVNILGIKGIGCEGQKIADIITEINAFTAKYNELVILELTHDFDTDNGYVSFSQAQWNALFQQLSGLNHLYKSTSSLDDTTMNTFIGAGQPAVVVLAELEPGFTLGSYTNQGFYTVSESTIGQPAQPSNVDFEIFNGYADSDSTQTMVSDQLLKLHNVRTNPKDEYFVYSHTLTLQNIEDLGGPGPPEESILSYTSSAYSALYNQSYAGFTSASYPNVLLIDSYGCPHALVGDQGCLAMSSSVAALAMAVNTLGSI